MVLKGIPTILTWNRLEGRPRRTDFIRSLQAEIRDPLWMLTRQWQMGEFKGEDAGSPVFTKAKIDTSRLNRYKPRNGTVTEFNNKVPLETEVENEDLDNTISLALEIGSYWKKLLKEGGLDSYFNQYISIYDFEMPPYVKEQSHIFAHSQVRQKLMAVATRGIDGFKFIKHLLSGGDVKENITVSVGDEAGLDAAARKFVNWYNRQYYQHNPQNWNPSQLEYQFKCSAPGDDGKQTVLVAEEFYQGHMDWYSFNLDDIGGNLNEPDGVTIDDDVRESRTLSFLPSPIEFGGMPNTRWWEMEDAKTDFGDVDANTTDIAKLLIIEFGLIYANDWFIIPFDVEAGTLASVRGVTVTDCFGRNFWIDRAGHGEVNDYTRFGMYTLTRESDKNMADVRLFVPPVTGQMLESEKIEKINLVRDEMANMVWAHENILQLYDGKPVRGAEAAYEKVEFLKSFIPPAPPPTPPSEPPSEPPSGPPADEALISYKLQSSVPENWIPFIPVHIEGSNREIQLQRAAMLRTLEGDTGTPKIEPRSKMLRVNLDTGEPYYVYEEEVPRRGTIVSRSFQRTRWHNGRVFTWLGRKKQTGHGEGSSGLKFDLITPKNK